MARPDLATKRRVSHLVGKYEQLAGEKRSSSATSSCFDDDEARAHSLNGESVQTRPRLQRRAMSMAPSHEAILEGKLTEERRRRRDLQDECEALRKRCIIDQESMINLQRKLEDSDLARNKYEEQRKYLEGKIESLRQQISSREEGEKLKKKRVDAEIEELRQQLSLSEETRQTDRELARAEHSSATARLRDAEGRAEAALHSAQNFERQLLELKQTLSASTRVETQASDQEIADKMSRLNHEVQNWVVNAFRKAKLDSPVEIKKRFEDLPITVESNLLHSLYSKFDPSTKLFAFQGIVVYLMMRVFEDDYFFGLPEGLRSLHTSAEIVKAPTAAYNEWRSHTFAFLQKADGELKEAIDAATGKRKGKLIHDISSVLSLITKTELTRHQLTSLDKIVDHAISLSRLLSVQRAVYTCTLPECDASERLFFDPHLNEDVFDAEDTSPNKTIRCVTFPAVLKAGDEVGDNMSLRNVILKAKVLCHAHDDDDEDDHDDDD